MSQNTSSAVMAQRVEPHDSLDFFPTPPWATRALCEHVVQGFDDPSSLASAWEPACGTGDMARPLGEYFAKVHASDVHDYGFGDVQDFLWFGPSPPGDVDWIITNPPFRLAQQFIERALPIARDGVAMLVRTAFLEAQGRYNRLFRSRPPSVVAQFSERVPMFKGKLDRKGSTATAYCWVVWLVSSAVAGAPPRFMWIPPCRARLERDADYAVPAAPAARAGFKPAPTADG